MPARRSGRRLAGAAALAALLGLLAAPSHASAVTAPGPEVGSGAAVAGIDVGDATGATDTPPDRGTGAVRSPVDAGPAPAGVRAAAAELRVDVADNVFNPDAVEIAPGDTVVWEQSGSNPHTITADDGSFDSHPGCPPNFAGCMQEGDTYERTFEAAGTYAYYCKVHGGPDGQGMAGTVVVQAAGAPAAGAPPAGGGGPAGTPSGGTSTAAGATASSVGTGTPLAATGQQLPAGALVAVAIGAALARVANRARPGSSAHIAP